ncbi:glycosyltransferase family 2 protein [Pseudomonas syringae group genomosp. 3]|uniref:glycosyltransferase family 2 protein n=1 Tax=Pseudomonas syringae group genomosp. 3 TaxID=251701 RepID=UPI0006E57C37|nr:Glycosyl transferase, family 2 [Pseudomonas syringae pv. berberidis]KPY23024.1 Glycosyl transferase, family 2 [Pseudomonas syringae pv. philadelphi]RMM30354.1 Glycosyl transferase, family 2 [Pseudomonas syringae pv. berberidis]RMP58951.1 Glycosyl transferase, family 2 [Pseudomonas syringae pv. berberidis]RMQ45314.1 Glycosyl transferase, family 2 [Pseudomonas syringae pv. berberidis]
MEHSSDMNEDSDKAGTWPANLFKTRFNHPPDWPAMISGVAYAPFRPGQSPYKQIFPTRDQIREDLLLLRSMTRNIRTYSVEGTLMHIPELADALGMNVTLGVWITGDETHNIEEINAGIELANRYSSVQRLVLGNEVLFRDDVPIDLLIHYLQTARRAVNVPVSTSEIWTQWYETPELVRHVDFIAAHILPFWEGVSALDASAIVLAHANELSARFPEKPLILSEIGWPSKAIAKRRMTTSDAEHSIYLRNQIPLLDQHGHDYYVIEAFDQHWKTEEGLPGPNWGLFDAKRRLKLHVSGPVKMPVNVLSELLRLITRLRPESWPSGALIIALAYCALAGLGMHYSQPLPVWLALPAAFIWAACVLTYTGIETHEFLEACWGPDAPRSFYPLHRPVGTAPKVSLHVPCYNEPANMVKRTLDSLQKLEYPDFEVLVIDNNTQDPAIWKPIELYCQQLGPRFRFFHVNPLPGFKAGALNYLLRHTAEDAEVVAVVDADYCVHRQWLKHMVPHFTDPKVAVIQSPQDYRDSHESLFKRCCQAEYRGFFNIGMVIRNDHDAIIQHGTMTLIRRSALDRLGWAQWCICEDAELGLRMLENGFSTGYATTSYGKGLTPDTFMDFKKQRYRWAYGAMQIVKRHAGSLIAGNCASLNAMQRYHFVAGWMPWMAEGMNYLLTLAALAWSMAMILKPETFEPLPWIFSTPLILMLALRSLKIVVLYRQVVSTNVKEALAAILAGMALYPTLGKAVLAGLVTSGMPFFRTPKHSSANRIGQTLLDVREELSTLAISWITIVLLFTNKAYIDKNSGFWIAMLFAQSLPYLAAVVMAILSALANRPSRSTT